MSQKNNIKYNDRITVIAILKKGLYTISNIRKFIILLIGIVIACILDSYFGIEIIQFKDNIVSILAILFAIYFSIALAVLPILNRLKDPYNEIITLEEDGVMVQVQKHRIEHNKIKIEELENFTKSLFNQVLLITIITIVLLLLFFTYQYSPKGRFELFIIENEYKCILLYIKKIISYTYTVIATGMFYLLLVIISNLYTLIEYSIDDRG